MAKDSKHTKEPLSLDRLAEDLADDKVRYHKKYIGREDAARDICSAVPDIRVRAALIDILTQSMITDRSAPAYRDLPERYFAGAQEYWRGKKEEGSLLFLPKKVFSSDLQLCEYYLDDILPEAENSAARVNIVRSLRAADCYMFLLTQYDLIALQPYLVRSIVTELCSAVEEILHSVAVGAGRVPEKPYDLVRYGLLTSDEQERLEEKQFSWGDAPAHELLYRSNAGDGDDSPFTVIDLFKGERTLTLGSFGIHETDSRLAEYRDGSDVTKCTGKNKILTALRHKRRIRLFEFNRALLEKGDLVLKTATVHPDSGGQTIKEFYAIDSYYAWFNRIRDLRNNVHFAALGKTLASTEEYSNLEITSEIYAFLHVTVEALKLYAGATR